MHVHAMQEHSLSNFKLPLIVKAYSLYLYLTSLTYYFIHQKLLTNSKHVFVMLNEFPEFIHIIYKISHTLFFNTKKINSFCHY